MIPYYYGFSLLVIFLITGCTMEPVRTTSQHVHFLVTDVKSGKAVDKAQVWLKYDIDHGNYYRKESWPNWYEQPWYTGFTNEKGWADIDIVTGALDWTRGSEPPADRDEVVGQPYRVKVKEGQRLEDFDLIMNDGEHIRGKLLTITIMQVQKPKYVREDSLNYVKKSVPPPPLKFK